jgi:hypothetical protein
MRRTILAFAVTMIVALGGNILLAHEDFRVIGTLTKHQDSRIEVKNRTGKITSIKLDKQTAISRDKKKVDATELKAGLSVVVDAYGDSEADLLALEIRIVPPIAAR